MVVGVFSGDVGSNHNIISKNVSFSTMQAVISSPSLIFCGKVLDLEIKQQDNINI